MKQIVEGLQSLGRALMLPIAVLPVAALLLRLGQPDLLNLQFISAAGGAMFSHLGLLFAIGVATGFAKDGNGAAPLAGVVCFLVATEGAKALLMVPPEVTAGIADAGKAAVEAGWRSAQLDKLAVPVGIIAGVVGGLGYNRFSGFRPPEYLAFFGGRRFVPIISGVIGVALAGLIGVSIAYINDAVDGMSRLALASGEVGLFIYGTLNRLLLVTGLHHILNNIAWFVLGDYNGTAGDLRRFFAGDPSAGAFMSGFFPVMMFGLPAACFAMYRSAKPERRKATGGMLLSLAATSFLTGVTEPIEFSFMFLAPVLFLLHALLTGAAMAIMAMLNVHLGFGFSAGLFDYVLNYSKAQHPLLLLPVGLAYATIYYALFRYVIVRFDLKTPGREDEDIVHARGAGSSIDERAKAFVAALGGAENLLEVGACTTRLRLIVADQAAVSEAALKGLGAKGLVRPSAQALQIVLGPEADQIASDILAVLASGAGTPASFSAGASLRTEQGHEAAEGSVAIDPRALPQVLVDGLGGAASLRSVRMLHNRLLVATDTPPDQERLMDMGLRGAMQVGDRWHLLFDPAHMAEWKKAAIHPIA